MSNPKNFFHKFSDKLKKIKHLDIILAVLFVAVILLIYFSSSGLFASKENSSNSTKAKLQEQPKPSSSIDEYSASLCSELERLVSSVKNAGNVNVLVFFEEGVREEIAYTYESKTMVDGTKVETKSPVLVDGTPIVLQTLFPTPKSVVVVATGAQNTATKLEIIRLVEAVLKIGTTKIEVFAGN